MYFHAIEKNAPYYPSLLVIILPFQHVGLAQTEMAATVALVSLLEILITNHNFHFIYVQ